MPWFKVDDTLHSHPKPRRVGLSAMGLWAVAGSHCMAYKLDGFVPRWYVDSWRGGTRLAAQLVEGDLWLVGEREGEAGWWFRDWKDYQPSSDEIELDREYARERQRRRRARLRAARKQGGDEA